MISDHDIEGALAALAQARGAGKTFCPSEVARALAADWRPLMPELRRVAGRMQAQGTMQAFQKGAPVDPIAARGPIRLGLPNN
ncbi:MAG: DUF3253 domain-containing protein [Pseudomonadota bacterium]